MPLGTSNDVFALAKYNNDGSLDTSFGINGKTTTNFDGVITTTIQQSDGKFVIGGTNRGFNLFLVARYNLDGSLDTSFGDNGRVTTVFTPGTQSTFVKSIVQQSDGKIIALGEEQTGRNFTADLAIAR